LNFNIIASYVLHEIMREKYIVTNVIVFKIQFSKVATTILMFIDICIINNKVLKMQGYVCCVCFYTQLKSVS